MGRRVIDYGRLLFYCKMMKRYFILSLVLLLSVVCRAQSQPEIIEQINQASAQMLSLECDFIQTKHLSILDDKMISQGKMYYLQADKLRWEYTVPYKYTFILNQNQVLINNDGRTDVIDVNQNKMFKEIARMMMDSIVGNCLTDQKAFKVGVEVKDGQWQATLVPLKRDMKQMWNKLILHIKPNEKVVYMVEMHEPSGDYTIIELKNIKKNHQISSEVFSIK